MTSVNADAIRKLIETQLLNGRAIELDEDLLLSGLLDSLGVMALVGHLEALCGDPIPHQDIILENFQTVAAIATYLNNG